MTMEPLWAAYASGDVEAILPLLAEDVVWEEADLAPGSQTWHGRDGVRALNQRWLDEFEGFRFESTGPEIRLTEDTTATPVSARGRGRTSGIEVGWELYMVTRFRDGLLARAFFAETLDEARRRL